jgi:phospholipid/cholesterol/gamma-HCH transport system ATP-binding protein
LRKVQRLVLCIRDAVFSVALLRSRETIQVRLDLRGGELAMVWIDRPEQGRLISDLCSGLVPPLSGSVRFLGRDWSSVGPDTAGALRGRIGRVFSRGGWVPQVAIRDQVLLPSIHHTRRSVDKIQEEAALLSRRVGLPGLPTPAPADCSPSDRRRAAWVRALMGPPALALLEEPTAEGGGDFLGPLLNAIRPARDRGTSVLWMTRRDRIWRDTSIPVSRRLRMVGSRLREASGK